MECRKQRKSAEEDAAFREQVEDFNARIKAYEEKRKVFEEKVNEYNASMQ